MKTKFFFLTMVVACMAITAKAGADHNNLYFVGESEDDSYYYMKLWGGFDDGSHEIAIPEMFVCEWCDKPVIPVSIDDNTHFDGGATISVLSIPSTVTTIGDRAFVDCTGLVDVSVAWENPASVTLGEDVFFGISTGSVNLHVPAGTKALYEAAAQWQDFNIIDDGERVTADLSSLTLSVGELSPAFHPDTREYFVYVGKEVSSVTFSATPECSFATVSGDGEKAVEVGDNTFSITVSLPDNGASRTYTVTVHRVGDCELVSGENFSTKTLGFTNPISGSFMYVNNRRLVTFLLSTGESSGTKDFVFTFDGTTKTQTATILHNSIYEINVVFDVIRESDYGDAAMYIHYNQYGQPSYAEIEYPRQGDFNLAISLDGNTIFSETDNFLARPKDIISVEFVWKSSSGIDEIDVPNLSVYPNPAKDYLVIAGLTCNLLQNAQIFDVSGRTVGALRATPAENGTATINVSHLPSGVYILKIGDKRAKFVKE
jgi:hypothetical protein